MTQPPLSRQIQLLEHQLGVQLLERSTRSVKLTHAGKAFYQQAMLLLEQAQYAAHQVQRIAAGEVGNLTLSFVSCAIYALIPALIQQLRSHYPQLNLQLKEQSSAQQLQALRQQISDIAIVRSAHPYGDFNSELLLSERFVLALPVAHPLADQTCIDLARLHQQPFILYSPQSWRPFHDIIVQLFQQHQLQPAFESCTGSTVTILSMVRGGLGVALVPAGAMQLQFHDVVYREIQGKTRLTSELFLVWRKDNLNPALDNVISTLHAAVNES